MACLNERIVGAICLLLSGYALADGPLGDAPEEMTVASIAPAPMEIVPSIPGPQTWLQRYEFQYQAQQHAPFDTQLTNFYSAQVTHDFRLGAGKAPPTPGVAQQQTSSDLHLGGPPAPALAITQLPDTILTIGAQPQRRLSLTVDEWVFSATARVAILHSHSTGATIAVRRGF
ncbi:hypothetical protein ACFSHT_38625 [Paraburkholderia silviterrae]|uniref:Peptidoglycan-binding protein CsiV n=1 Tax=Paraburkholderia silviterrae TaxID=2528715 RepID=A0A4R5LZB5_9BURK|nr:hypothetical protein [Paraburkholderia silviterrae]TDG17874.1 hypothetical protein EYW47_36480 [Paraburkholderia silviterrae]